MAGNRIQTPTSPASPAGVKNGVSPEEPHGSGRHHFAVRGDEGAVSRKIVALRPEDEGGLVRPALARDRSVNHAALAPGVEPVRRREAPEVPQILHELVAADFPGMAFVEAAHSSAVHQGAKRCSFPILITVMP